MKKVVTLIFCIILFVSVTGQRTQKPVLHGKNWMAITGKPLAATAGAIIFQQGGNAVDAACAMLAATCTMWDVLSWGGETQAMIYHPRTKKVIAINALGVAPTGATPQFFLNRSMSFPPEYGPLAAITPGTPGGLCHMLARYGTMSLKQVLAPAMQLAQGFPADQSFAMSVARNKNRLMEWPYSKKLFITSSGETPQPGEIFIQKDLYQTLQKLVEAEEQALKKGSNRQQGIMAANDRFYKGDIAREFVRGCREQGGLITMDDLANWKPLEEEPLHTSYKGIDVYKLQQWTQGPALLQALNILEQFDLKAMGYNSSRYIHTIYQAMNMAFADRDFYYGDPYFPPQEPVRGLLSKQYAKQRAATMLHEMNNAQITPGDPYPFEGKENPYLNLLQQWRLKTDTTQKVPGGATPKHDVVTADDDDYNDRLWRGTTSIQAADAEGWVVSITPSGGWIPACIAGNTGVG